MTRLALLLALCAYSAADPAWQKDMDAGKAAFANKAMSQAEKAYASAVKKAEKFGRDVRRGESLIALARVQRSLSKLDDAANNYLLGLDLLQELLPVDDLRLAGPLDEFGEVMAARGDFESAVTLGLHAARIYATAYGPRDSKVGLAAERLARHCVKAEEIAKAIGYYDQAVAVKEKNLGPKNPGLLPLLDEYAAMLREAKLPKEAERIEAKAAAIRKPKK